MTRRTFSLLAGIGYLALLYLHVRSSYGRSSAVAPAQSATGAMTYLQFVAAVRAAPDQIKPVQGAGQP